MTAGYLLFRKPEPTATGCTAERSGPNELKSGSMCGSDNETDKRSDSGVAQLKDVWHFCGFEASVFSIACSVRFPCSAPEEVRWPLWRLS